MVDFNSSILAKRIFMALDKIDGSESNNLVNTMTMELFDDLCQLNNGPVKEALNNLCEKIEQSSLIQFFQKMLFEADKWDLREFSSPVMRQIKAIFTTICIMERIDADTDKSDDLVMLAWSIFRDKNVEFPYEEFYNFMVSDIV